MDKEPTDGLEELNALVARAVVEQPELKALYQQVRASFAISDILLALFKQASVSAFLAGSRSGISASVVEEMLTATSETPVTVALVSRLVGGAGYRVGVSLLPAHTWLMASEQPPNVFFEFANPGDWTLLGEAMVIRRGMNEFAENAPMLKNVLTMNTRAAAAAQMIEQRAIHGTTFAALLGLADEIDYKVEVRFSPVGLSTTRQHARNIEAPVRAQSFQTSRPTLSDSIDES